MRLNAALLADYAAVRDGLLHLVGGGINRLVRPQFPTRIGATLVLMVSPEDAADLRATHVIEIVVIESANEKSVADLRLTWPGVSASDEASSSFPPLYIVVPIQDIELSRSGLYRLAISMDEQLKETLEFIVVGQNPEATASVEEPPAVGQRN